MVRDLKDLAGNLVQSGRYDIFYCLIVLQMVSFEAVLNPRGLWQRFQVVICQKLA